MELALFDFDGTITNRDSFLDFIVFVRGKAELYACLLKKSPLLVANKLGVLSSKRAKESVLTYFFKDMPESEFRLLGKAYCREQIGNIVKAEAMEKILWHKNNGHRVVIVSASVRQWLEPWCEKEDLELICTEIGVNANILTGKIEGENCNGKEKVKRIKLELDLNKYQKIYAYGNSFGDKAMLDLADEKFYNKF